MGCAVDEIFSLDLIVFVAASFASSLVAGLAGFAFGLVAAGIWLHVISPAQTAALIVGFGMLVQGISVWKLRGSISVRRLLPFLVGGAVGVPAGVELLRWISAAHMRSAVGIVLILFSLYSLARPRLATIKAAGRAADGAVGFLNGVLGGATGLAGILTVVWCSVRGWSKDEQRAVFQPVGVAVFAMTALWLGGTGLIDRETVRLFLLGLPAVLIGTWLGLRLYRRLDEVRFRKIVLMLLLLSGVALVV